MTDPADFLVASTGRLIRAGAAALDAGPSWAEDTALVILAQPALRTAVLAADTVAVLRARHQPRPYGPGSETVVCTCGSGAFEACEDARLLNPTQLAPEAS